MANQFITTHRDGEGIKLATYFFPDHSDLADLSLDATEKYFEVHTGLLGSYPLPKFAVVENFFPSG